MTTRNLSVTIKVIPPFNGSPVAWLAGEPERNEHAST